MRLFTTPRDIDFLNDTAKEFTKDVVGQKIYYYPISVLKTRVHDVYEESPDKIFDDPIEIECLMKWEPSTVKSTGLGSEYSKKVECYLHSRDLIDREIEPKEGDFFTFGPRIYEITSATADTIIHGQVEYEMGVLIKGLQARKSQFEAKVFGPTKESFSDEDAVQKTFVQQRGLPENRLGPTGDTRELVKQGVLEGPENGPTEVSENGATALDTNESDRSSFYGDDD